MAKKVDYTVTRVPFHDWNNLMETVSLDGSYSDEIKEEVWTAIENMEDFSYPWVVLKIVDGNVIATIFGNKDAAIKYIENSKNRSKGNGEYHCVKAVYKSRG